MIKLYTDGGSDNKGGGGAACIIESNSETICFCYFLGDATNNECEISAALFGLAYIRKNHANNKKVEWISDSEYSLKSATQYINTWVRNGWRTSQKEPVKNQGLWKTFLNLSNGINIIPSHVKGHSGHTENEACDLAVNWLRKNKDLCNNDWLSGYLDIGDKTFPKWVMKDERGLLSQIRELDSENGISEEDFIDHLDFSKLDQVLSKPLEYKEPRNIKLKMDPAEERIKLTKSFLKKISEIDKSETPDNLDYQNAIKLLSTWLDKS